MFHADRASFDGRHDAILEHTRAEPSFFQWCGTRGIAPDRSVVWENGFYKPNIAPRLDRIVAVSPPPGTPVDSTAVDGVGIKATCTTVPKSRETHCLFVLLPREHLFVVTGGSGAPCDPLTQFARTAIPRIGT